jgi:hypothetical protein
MPVTHPTSLKVEDEPDVRERLPHAHGARNGDARIPVGMGRGA